MNSFDDFQMFGTAETAAGQVHLMLCKDVDSQDEVAVHYFSDAQAGGFICKMERRDQVLVLRPTVLLDVGADGKTLFIPSPISADRIESRDASFANFTENEKGLEGHWFGQDGRGGKVFLTSKFPVPETSLEVLTIDSWSAFKLWVASVRREIDAASFRGHGSNAFKLKTSFHRAGLHRVERFSTGRLLDFKFHAEALLNEKFDMNNPQDYATVLGLAQHHGLPTPMLDWTGSPYIAAFFAFSDAVQEQASRSDVEYVRVFALSRSFMDAYSPPLVTLRQVRPYAEWLQISARINPRLYMQRGQFLVTNVAELENLLLACEQETGKKLLRCVDIPVSCASEALEDLEFMGLSAAALFPGLDGVCRMMRNQITYRAPRNVERATGLAGPSNAPPKMKSRSQRKGQWLLAAKGHAASGMSLSEMRPA